MARNTTTKAREAIEVLSFTDYQGSKNSSLLGFAQVRIDRIVVSGIRLLSGEHGFFISMPQEKGSDGNYYNTVWANTGSKEGNKQLYDDILECLKEYYENM